MKNWICNLCSNGCRLEIRETGPGAFLLQGNRCNRGFNYARFRMGGGARLYGRDELPDYTLAEYQELAKSFGQKIVRLHPALFVQGSPERTAFRMVVEDEQGQKHLLEKIRPEEKAHKLSTAQILALAKSLGVPYVVPYYLTRSGDSLLEYDNGYWQMLPFLVSAKLNRRTYAEDGWRGELLADFLLSAREKLSAIPEVSARPRLVVSEYVQELFMTIKKERPPLALQLMPLAEQLLDKLKEAEQILPLAFCHGDPHPLNMIWDEREIVAVLDWEFCGLRNELYDPALLIGCVGSDNPENLTKPLVKSFLAKLQESGRYRRLDHLPWFVAGVRFAWLSEWLRRGDEEMIDQEVVYLRLLAENGDGGSLIHL